MQEIRLGRSELKVSRIAFGTWQLGGDWGATDEEAALAAIRRAAERGINFFDTAQGYGFGASERLLAKALKDRPRDHVVIATKGGLRPTARGGVERDASPDWIRRGVDASLQALGTDYIDVYQIHWPFPEGSLRGNGRRIGRSEGRRQDSSRRSLQLRHGADGGVQRDTAG